MMLYIVIISLILSISLNAALIYFLFHYATMVFAFEDQLNDSVTRIKKSEDVINEILKRPLFYDSPEVRRVLDSIKQTKNEIIVIANSLGMVEDKQNDSKHE